MNRRFSGSAFRLCKHFFPEFDWKHGYSTGLEIHFGTIGGIARFHSMAREIIELNDDEEWYNAGRMISSIMVELVYWEGITKIPASAIMD